MDTKEKVQFSPEMIAKIEELKTHYPAGKQKSALLPVLHLVQKEYHGWVSIPVMNAVAEALDIKPIEVYEVATFYTMFNLKPVGKVVLEVCRTGPCCLLGAEKTIAHIEKRIGCKVGETSPDGMFTLKTVECLGACGYAPMMQVGDHYFEHLTDERVDQLLEEFRNKAKSAN